jgi:hypothetical protein
MGATIVNGDEWLAEITAQARRTNLRVLSVSVPVSHPETPVHAYEQLLSEAIDAVEHEGWKLESMSTYGNPGSPYDSHPRFWSLLIFRTAYRGHG